MRVGYAYDLLRFISILTINKQKHFFYVKELMIRKQMKIKTIYIKCVWSDIDTYVIHTKILFYFSVTQFVYNPPPPQLDIENTT